MNAKRTRFPLLLGAVLLVLTLGCGLDDLGDLGDGASTPKAGRWTITELTGEIKEVDSGSACSGSWTYPADPESSWNGVRVDTSGGIEYYLGFKGVEGSSFPDSYNDAGSGTGKSGVISGRHVREDLGTVTTISGTYDDSKMTVEWTTEQHVGEEGGCKIDVTGSGTFVATAPY